MITSIRNEVIRENVGMVVIKNKIRETRLGWFGHINRRDANASM